MKIKLGITHLVCSALFIGCFYVGANAANNDHSAEPSRPNIVVILADDYGYGSAGCYGADSRLVSTPNLDRLAAEGMRFLDANTPSSVCSPTRYALMTGRYFWRNPSRNDGTVVWTMDPLIIETDRPTISSLLKSKGYQTGFVGKWHLGYGTAPVIDYRAELKPGPLELGFDYQFAVPQNHGDFTNVYVENHRVFGLRSDKFIKENGRLGLDAPQRNQPETMNVLTDVSVKWLQQVDKEHPFFFYFAPITVHGPITPSSQTQGTTKAGPYGDFISDLDMSVGRILSTLDEMGVADNTLVVFTSDNGGVIRGKEGGAQQVAMKAGLEINGHLKGGKHDIWQGGFQVPFIVRWPGHVQPGSESSAMVNIADMYATISDILGDPVPTPFEAAPDSFSFLPVLTGEGTSARDGMILQSVSGVYAIRKGKWKLVEGYPSSVSSYEKRGNDKDQFTQQLFDLEADPGEKKDLSKKHPEVVKELLTLLTAHRNQGFSR